MVSANMNATFSRRASESRRAGGRGSSSKVGNSGNVSLNLSQVMNAQNNLSMIDAALGEVRQLLMQKESLLADIDALEQRKAILSQEVQVLEQRQHPSKKKNNRRVVQQNQGPTPPYHYGITEVEMVSPEEDEEGNPMGKEKRSNSAPDLGNLNCSLYGNGVFDEDDDDDSRASSDEEDEEEETNSNASIQAPAWRRSNSIVSNANKRNMKYHPPPSDNNRTRNSTASNSSSSNQRGAGNNHGNNGGEEAPSPPQKYICPLTWEIMKFPMRQKGSVHNKHYERGAILEWIYFGKATDPLTRQKLHPSDFELNVALQLEIQQWCDQHGYYDEEDNRAEMEDESFEEQQARTKRKLLRTLTPDQEREQQGRLSRMQGKRQGSTNQLMGLRDRILQKRDDRIRRSDRIQQQRRQSER